MRYCSAEIMSRLFYKEIPIIVSYDSRQRKWTCPYNNGGIISYIFHVFPGPNLVVKIDGLVWQLLGDVISHENQSQHYPNHRYYFMLDVFRTADHAGHIFIPHRPSGLEENKSGFFTFKRYRRPKCSPYLNNLGMGVARGRLGRPPPLGRPLFLYTPCFSYVRLL